MYNSKKTAIIISQCDSFFVVGSFSHYSYCYRRPECEEQESGEALVSKHYSKGAGNTVSKTNKQTRHAHVLNMHNQQDNVSSIYNTF